MGLLELFQKHYELNITPIPKFEIVLLDKYFDEEENRYKHIIGVASQMQALIKQLDLPEQEASDLMQIAYLHDIGYSKRVKSRSHHAMDGAIYAIEKGLSETIALSVMFHTAAFGEAKLLGGETKKIYDQAHKIFLQNEEAKKYVELITYCDLNTEIDGKPTSVSRRVFKILARYDKSSAVYKNIKAHKRYFKRLDKRIRTSVSQENEFLKMMRRWLDVLSAKQ